MPQKMVAKEGYAQNLWLHGEEHYLTEVGTMNLFVVFEQGDSKDQVYSQRFEPADLSNQSPLSSPLPLTG